MDLSILPIETSPHTPFISVTTSGKLLLNASAHNLGRCCSCSHQKRWWGRRQSQRAPSSLFVEHCRSKVRFPAIMILLHRAIKGAEARENSGRLNQLFWEVPNFYTRSAGAAGTNCVLWEEKGELPCSVAGPGYTCMLHRSGQLNPRAQSWGTTELGRGCHTWAVWVLEQMRSRWDTWQGYRVIFTPPQLWE